MNKIRNVHLYLGCFFAPMLSFFAVSGTWQELHLQWHNDFLNLLSSIHTGNGIRKTTFQTGHRPTSLSDATNLSSPYLIWLIVLMAASLVLNIILGIIMAFRFGRRTLVLASIAAGAILPLLLIFFFAQ
jgi:hypothetical protein